MKLFAMDRTGEDEALIALTNVKYIQYKAPTKFGKTLLATDAAVTAMNGGMSVLYVTDELTDWDIISKIKVNKHLTLADESREHHLRVVGTSDIRDGLNTKIYDLIILDGCADLDIELEKNQVLLNTLQTPDNMTAGEVYDDSSVIITGSRNTDGNINLLVLYGGLATELAMELSADGLVYNLM